MDDTTASGRFLLRIDPGLHAALRTAARRGGLSLNELCARSLAGGPLHGAGPAWPAVMGAAEVAGGHLLAVLAFGSWARGEAAEGSDVDVLVVVDPALPLGRDLYRVWDREAITWEGRPVEPHFVHPPAEDGRISSLWAEVAVDGVVLFDPGLELARRLARIRRRIVAGELVRKEAHGHPYWVDAP